MSKQPRIQKVILEFDTEIRSLTGQDAELWQKATQEQGVFCWTHNFHFPDLNWKVTKKEID